MPVIRLLPSPYRPTTTFTGQEQVCFIRGQNCRLIGASSNFLRLVSFQGCRYEKIFYDPEVVASQPIFVNIVANNPIITFATALPFDLTPGQQLLTQSGLHLIIEKVISDTQIKVTQTPTVTFSGKCVILPVLFEIDKTHGVLLRGNAIKTKNRDIIAAGAGNLYVNGALVSATPFITGRPVRFEWDGTTYVRRPIGFDSPPPIPEAYVVSGGAKKRMLNGRYSFMFSYYCRRTRGFSNPTPPVKFIHNTSSPLELTIPNQRFRFNFTPALANMPNNAEGFIIWQSQSGQNDVTVNFNNYQNGSWFEAAIVHTIPLNITGVDLFNAELLLNDNYLSTGDSVFLSGSSLPVPLLPNVEYFVIGRIGNRIQLATTYENALAGIPIILTTAGSGQVSQLNASNDYFHECLDAELGQEVSGNNDPPPPAAYVADFSNSWFFLSVFGEKRDSKETRVPGNYCVMSKTTNREAYPSDWAVSVGNEIHGFALGAGRLFCLTENSVPFIAATGRTELARLTPIIIDHPFTSRPFWTKGNISPYALLMVQNDLFLYQGNELLISPRTGDALSNPFSLSAVMVDIFSRYHASQILLGHCPYTNQICVFVSGTGLNQYGYWESKIYPYDLKLNMWQPEILITHDACDMLVSGVATINNRLYFLAGGRQGSGFITRLFKYFERTDDVFFDPIDYYAAFQFTDVNEEQFNKRIRSVRLTGRCTASNIQIFNAGKNGTINLDDIENGINYHVIVPVNASSLVRRYHEIRVAAEHLNLWALRIAGSWSVTTPYPSDEIHELTVEYKKQGSKF